MKKSLFYVALGAMVLTSCAQDEVLDTPKNAVQFTVATENAGRGSVITTGNINEFNVTAFLQKEFEAVGGDTYTGNANIFMEDVTVSKVGGAWEYDVLKFWPNNGAINFYSYAPIAPEVVENFEAAAQTITYTVPEACADQLDVVYAFNKGLTKSTDKVPVNFRHALSQVVFKAKNKKEDLRIVIDGIRVVNLNNSGVLSMPTESTTLLAADAQVESDNSWGTWAVVNDPTHAFAADLKADTLQLTDASAYMSDAESPLLLMPQTLTPATIVDNKMQFTGGAYVAVSCKIFSVESGNQIQLWPAAAGATAEVAIPLTSPDKVEGTPVWKQGRRYIYTLVFGEGAGYIGEGQPNEGEPVLVPVTFEVTVDSFQDVVNAVSMNTGNPTL